MKNKRLLIVVVLVVVILLAVLLVGVILKDNNNTEQYDDYEQYKNQTVESLDVVSESEIQNAVNNYINENLNDVNTVNETVSSGSFRQYTVMHGDNSTTIITYNNGEITHVNQKVSEDLGLEEVE